MTTTTTLHITLTGTNTNGMTLAGRVILMGPTGASIIDATGYQTFIPRDTVTRVFCRALGGRVDYDTALQAIRTN